MWVLRRGVAPGGSASGPEDAAGEVDADSEAGADLEAGVVKGDEAAAGKADSGSILVSGSLFEVPCVGSLAPTPGATAGAAPLSIRRASE